MVVAGNSTNQNSTYLSTSAAFKITAAASTAPKTTTPVPTITFDGIGAAQFVKNFSFQLPSDMDINPATFQVTSGPYQGLGFTVPAGAWPSDAGPPSIIVIGTNSNMTGAFAAASASDRKSVV